MLALIFPQLRPYLEECFELAGEGAEFVISRYRDLACNLRSPFQKIILRAGEQPWPKLFHNLRASMQTELADEYPLYVVCRWIGNSAPVADKYCLAILEANFIKAAGGDKSGEDSGDLGVLHGAAGKRTEIQKKLQPHGIHEVVQIDAELCGLVQGNQTPRLGK